MIEVVRADELGEGSRRALGEVFISGFGKDFSFFSKDPRKLVDAFSHMLVLDVFWVALVDGKPAGMAACTDGRRSSVVHDAKELRTHLGLVKGTIANVGFNREFHDAIPDPRAGKGSIEFVATSANHRGQGIGTVVLKHLLAMPQYHEYVIMEVADTNTAALALYRKLGFTEYRRVKVNHTWWTGINSYVSLRLVQPAVPDAV